MKVIDPGHVYELNWLDHVQVDAVVPDPRQQLIFVKREGEGYPGNVGHHPGTNIQEVLRALIDRVKYLDTQIKHPYNQPVITHLRNAMMFLEWRAAERHNRDLTLANRMDELETLPTCVLCGHIGCEGTCHAAR